MKALVTICVLFLALVGCVEVQDSKIKSEDKKIEVLNLSYNIEALAQPQAYLVRFSGVNCEKIVTKVTQSKSDQKVQLSECSEVVNEPGIHTYHFAEGSLQVEIPKDIIVKGVTRLKDLNPKEVEVNNRYSRHLKIDGRLYFESGSILSTDGESVLIEAGFVSSDGGRIATHVDPLTADYAHDGKHGGLIHLKSPKIHGAIEILLRGQSGGDGEPNYYILQKKVENMLINGGNGGNSGQFWLETLDDSMSLIKIVKQPGASGKGVEVKGGCGFGSGSGCEPRVIRPRGSDGQAGLEEKSCLIKNNQCTSFNSN